MNTTTEHTCRRCGNPTTPLDVAGRTIVRAHCSDECFYAEFPNERPRLDVPPDVPQLSWHQRRELDWQAMIPPRQQAYDFHQLRPLAQAAIRANEAYDGKRSMLITGASTAGKTYVAYRLARLAYLAGVKVRCVTADGMRAKWLSEGGGERYLDMLKTTGLLLIDDVGMESASPAWCSVIYEVVNKREEEHRPCIITANREERYYAQNYSRGLANRLWRMEVVRL
jgi:DNA replication protein DnaC